MLAADAELEVGAGATAALGGDAHQLADPFEVEAGERVARQDPGPLVIADEARRIVARDAEGGLGQVVGAEAEEFDALSAISAARSAARGSSIMVPTA